MKYFFALLLCGVQQASARTNAGGACTDITDKATCCTMYDARLSTAAASNCVPALDTFTNGAKCEAEAMVIERGECALVGLCQDHVQVASAACLNTVVDQVTVKGVMHGPWIGAGEYQPEVDGKITAFRYNGFDLKSKKENLFIFALYTDKYLKMTGATLGEMVDEADPHTEYGRDRYITHNSGSAQERALMTQDGIDGIWDGLNDGYITVVPERVQGRTTDSNGKGYQVKDIEITVDRNVFTTKTTTTTTTATTTTTTNTALAQLSKDLESLLDKMSDTDMSSLVSAVQTLEATLEDEVEMRKAADAEVAALKQQVAQVAPLEARLKDLEAIVKAHMTLPVAIKAAVQDMQPKNPSLCSSGGTCAPEVSGTDSADLALTAQSGKVLMQTSECGTTDMCTLVKAVQALLENFD